MAELVSVSEDQKKKVSTALEEAGVKRVERFEDDLKQLYRKCYRVKEDFEDATRVNLQEAGIAGVLMDAILVANGGMSAEEALDVGYPPGAKLRIRIKSVATYSKTFKSMKPWAGWAEHLEATRRDAQQCKGRYNPYRRAGLIDDQAASASTDAGDVDEFQVRYAIEACSRLVSHVSKEIGYNMQLAGNGSNRALSDTDWLVRDLRTDHVSIAAARKAAAAAAAAVSNTLGPNSCAAIGPNSVGVASRLRPATLAQRKASNTPGATSPMSSCTTPLNCHADHSHRIHACIKCKPAWQAELKEGMDLESTRPAAQARYLPALQQLFGDMVLEETCMGMLMTQTGHIVVRRTGLNTLEYSPVIKTEQLPWSLLALARGCFLYAGEEGQLKRDKVPLAPTSGWEQQDPRQCWPRAKRKCTSSQTAAESPCGKRYKGAGNQRGSQKGKQRQVVVVNQCTTDTVESSSAQGLSTMGPALPPFTPGVSPSSLLSVGFGAVGLTGHVYSKTRRATVAEGRVNNQPVAIKWFPQDSSSSALDLQQELDVYGHLHTLESSPAPKLLAAGRLAHTQAAFLAIEYVGSPITTEQLQQRSEAVAVAHALATLHKSGVAHGDIYRANFLRSDAGGIKVVDFTEATLLCTAPDEAELLCEDDASEMIQMFKMAGASDIVVGAAEAEFKRVREA